MMPYQHILFTPDVAAIPIPHNAELGTFSPNSTIGVLYETVGGLIFEKINVEDVLKKP